MRFDRNLLRLYAVTDRTWLEGRSLFDDVEEALRGGATMVQLREKGAAFDEVVNTAVKMKELCSKYNVPLIINDNVYAAKAAGADGVHLGQDDMPPDEARKILGDGKIIGVTAKTVTQAKKAQDNGADYLGSGAVFGTSTKSNAKKLEIAELKEITKSVSIPVAAIGGINAENVLTLKNTGIAGAAVVSGIFAKRDIEKAARELYKRIGEII